MGNARRPYALAAVLCLGLGAEALAQGTILREWWTGVSGTTVADLADHPGFPANSMGSEYLDDFEGPTDWDDDYGSRLSGVLIVPETGEYTFWVASDDNSQLWLSSDGDPVDWIGSSPIAWVSTWTSPRQWYKEVDQQSDPIYLEQGMEYYIRALHKEGGGGDNLCVRWRLPSGVIEEPIPGSRVGLYMDDLPPTIVRTFPADGDVGVDTSASVEIHFSEIMEPDNMLTAFQLFDSGASLVAGTSYFTGRVLRFTPEPDLGRLETYVGSLDPAGLLDRAGNPLPAGVIFSFATSDNDVPPTVDYTSPAGGDVGVDVSVAVEIHFSEAMRDQNMLTSFLLFDSDNVLVAGTSSFSDPVLTFTPMADLKDGETYMGVLTANDLLDLAGNALQAGMTFSFTTFDPTPPPAEGCVPASSGFGAGAILCLAAAILARRRVRTQPARPSCG